MPDFHLSVKMSCTLLLIFSIIAGTLVAGAMKITSIRDEDLECAKRMMKLSPGLFKH